jgi:putative ABC transport system permease protein
VTLIRLSNWDLGLALALVLLMAALSLRLRLAVERPLLISTLRMAVQLVLIGYVLKFLFAAGHPAWVAVLAGVMLLVAGREATARQRVRLAGPWGYGVGTGAMFVSAFAVALLALTVMLAPEPWYRPRYAIPLLGLMLGNTMTAVALGMNHLLSAAADRREQIEQRLALGEPYAEAVGDLRREAVHTGLIPIINAMAAAGIVSLPGIMTGQILAGAPPVEAVKYQILIMLLIAGSAGLGLLASVWVAGRRLFDERHRLRLDRLSRTDRRG